MNGERINQTYHDDSGYGKNYDDLDGVDHAEHRGAQWRGESFGMHETGEDFESREEGFESIEYIESLMEEANLLDSLANKKRNEAFRGMRRLNRSRGAGAIRGASRTETQPATGQADASEGAQGAATEAPAATGSDNETPGE